MAFKIIIFLYLLLQVHEMKSGKYSVSDEIGTTLFEDHGFLKKCFSQEDIALLSTRLKFQTLLPSTDNPHSEPFGDKTIKATLKYLYSVNELISIMTVTQIRDFAQKSYYDMLGGYLKHYFLPVIKFSYYTGNVSYATASSAYSLFERCKELLDTNGNGWKDPITDFSRLHFKIDPIDLSNFLEDEGMKSCVSLVLNKDDADNEEDMLVELPKIELEENEELSTIWIPFKRKHIFNLNSQVSAFILMRYFVVVSKCYHYQGTSQIVFNRKLKEWITQNVIPYLNDDKIYPAFGAALRILETIKQPNEGNYLGVKKSSTNSKALFKTEVYSEKTMSHGFLDKILIAIHAKKGTVDDFFDSEENEGSDNERKMINYAMFAIAGIIFLAVLICLTVKIISNCHNSKNKERKPKSSLKAANQSKRSFSKSDGTSQQSIRNKLCKCFSKSIHIPSEPDEDDYYKKTSPADRTQNNEEIFHSKTIKFENEQSSLNSLKERQKTYDSKKDNYVKSLYSRQKSKKPIERPTKSSVSFERLLKSSSPNKVPVLPGVGSETDTDDETIMKKTSPLAASSKKWFHNKKTPNNNLYKISEESEGSPQLH